MAKIREENQVASFHQINRLQWKQEESLHSIKLRERGLGGCKRFGDSRGAEQGFFFQMERYGN